MMQLSKSVAPVAGIDFHILPPPAEDPPSSEHRVMLVDYTKHPREHVVVSCGTEWPRKLDNRTALISARRGCTSLNLPPFEIWNKKPSSEIWKVSSNAELAGRSSSTNHTDDPMVNFFIKIPKDLGKSTEKVHKLREFFNREERKSNRLQSHSLAKTLRSRSMSLNQAGSATHIMSEPRMDKGQGHGSLV